MQRYNPKQLEPKWQQKWAADKLYAAKDFDDKPKYVMLTEFPYPSGAGIHIGHAREFTYGDIISRYKRMNGYNVLFPMGYDAFGLPTENYAIKHKVSPQKATDDNVAMFQKQFESLGYGIDWDRSFRTSDPDYYKWTQWLFLKFYEKGLAYQDEIAINWCPFEKTGLANEEVVNGRHERCGTEVEKKLLKQWLLKITDYADRLIDGLKTVDYPSRIADQQINWIGRSKGAEVSFKLADSDQKIDVFTTRADTIFGATFMVLAPEHPLVEVITTKEHRANVDSYIKATQAKSDVERQDTDRTKTGVSTGAHAINPATGEKIPVWIADYVLMGYGTGAIMAVPAHDERDGDFARKYNLPIVPVVAPEYIDETSPLKPSMPIVERNAVQAIVKHPTEDKYLLLGLKAWTKPTYSLPMGGIDDGETPEVAGVRELLEETGYNDVGTVTSFGSPYFAIFYHEAKQVNRRAKISTIIVELKSLNKTAIAEDEQANHEPLWVTADELQAKVLGEGCKNIINNYLQGDKPHTAAGVLINSKDYDNLTTAEARDKIVADLEKQGVAKERINYRLRDWIFSRQHYWGEPIPIIHCAEHGPVAVPEDQLPITLPAVEHYEPTDSGESPLAAITDWVNTTCPTCGKPAKRETDTMPNWAGSSWYYLRYYDAHNDKTFADPAKLQYWGAVDLYLGGMEHTTLHLLYSRFWHEFLYDQKLVPTAEPYAARRGQGIILAADNTKMSKSRGNVVNPTDIIDSGYGADALRLTISFLAPYDQTTPWSPDGVSGTYRFLQRLWALVGEHAAAEKHDANSADVRRAVHSAIKQVSHDLDELGFNTSIATLMESLNTLYKLKLTAKLGSAAWQESLEAMVQMVAPFAPHITEELWQQLGKDGSVHISPWPKSNEKYLAQDSITIAVQVNGKVRGRITIVAQASESEAVEAAKHDDNVAAHLKGKQIVKTIYVQGRILNLVVK